MTIHVEVEKALISLLTPNAKIYILIKIRRDLTS